MGDGLHEQKRSTLVATGSSDWSGARIRLHVDERAGD